MRNWMILAFLLCSSLCFGKDERITQAYNLYKLGFTKESYEEYVYILEKQNKLSIEDNLCANLGRICTYYAISECTIANYLEYKKETELLFNKIECEMQNNKELIPYLEKNSPFLEFLP